MQKNNASNIDLKFILITEELSFIPDNILTCCQVIPISRPTKYIYNKCLKQKNKLTSANKTENINNIKNLHNSVSDLITPYKIICDKIIESIIKTEDINFLKFRDLLYDIFIYDLNITECIWYIIYVLSFKKLINKKNMSSLLIKTYTFFQYYNNNYRPIYHLENYLFYIVCLIHKYE
jgi:hypothetical protein